jgi:hypothetical protein
MSETLDIDHATELLEKIQNALFDEYLTEVPSFEEDEDDSI